jgi:uncharacterized Tic20 family protein
MQEEHGTTPADAGTNMAQNSPPPAPVPAAQGMTVNTWAMLTHLASLTGFIFPVVGNIVGPLVVWIIKKDEMPEVDRHGKASLNFQISLLIWLAIAWAVVAVLCIVVIGFVLVPVLGIAQVVVTALFPVLAGLKANEGGWYDYPMTIQFIK